MFLTQLTESLLLEDAMPETRAAITLEKLLFATDFSETSDHAFALVKKLARTFSSEVKVLHVMGLSKTTTPETTAPLGELKQHGEQELRRLGDDLRASGIRESSMLVNAGQPAPAIQAVADEYHPDLIIVGTRGARHQERFVLGSTADELIRHVTCPVLTVGPQCVIPASDALQIQRILYATDFSPEAAEAAEYALTLAEETRAHITLCHVAPEHFREDTPTIDLFRASLQKLVPQAALDWCTPKYTVTTGSAAEQILDLASVEKPDLIVLGVHRALHFQSQSFAGIAYRVLADAPCPVVTLRDARPRPGAHLLR